MAKDSTKRGQSRGQADPNALIVQSVGFNETQTIMGRVALKLDGDGALEDVLLVLTALTFNDDASARQTLLDAATRPLLPFHGAANDALKSALVARARSLQAA